MNTSHPRRALRQKLLRAMVPIIVMGASFYALANYADLPRLVDIIRLVRDVPLPNWLGAIGATILSFWALGRYDAVAHRHLRTGLDCNLAHRAGMASIAFSQAAGFGILTGTFARWRLLPQLSPVMAAQLTGFVGITFMTALAAICGLSLLIVAPQTGLRLLGAGIMATSVLACALCFLFPEWRIRGTELRLPSLQAIAALGVWTFADIACAGVALWLLLPEGHGIGLTSLLPAYFLALGLAIISSSPGGAGPLELSMLALLPTVDPATVIAGLVAFRGVYYLLPAAVGGVVLLWPNLLRLSLPAAHQDDLMGQTRRPAASQPFDRPQAETAVMLQNGGAIMTFGLNQVALLDSPQLSAMFFDPISGATDEIPDALSNYAKSRNATACIYKCGGRMALAARTAGWKTLRIAQDAILYPATFRETGSTFRQLRRKLRHAEKAGLTVEVAWGDLPIRRMADIDTEWCNTHGFARGTTMGRFEPGYVSIQLTVLAWREGTIEGYMTFHRSANEWCLDLVRMRQSAPDGTGHALVHKAIEAAREAGIARLSLASVPDHAFAHRMEKGLKQFKSCFAPSWEPRYIATRSWPQMGLALLEMIRLVHRPAPLSEFETLVEEFDTFTEPAMHEAHIDDEQKAIALKRSA